VLGSVIRIGTEWALYSPKRSLRSVPFKENRMKEMSEKLGSLDDPWPRSCKIGARIHRIDAVFLDSREIEPIRIIEQLSCALRRRS
jgi:hypothetical protein